MNSSGASQAAPQVSVLLSTHNRAELLPRAIESVLAQEAVALELLVVDDCSADATPELLRRLAGDPRLRLFRNSHNRGLPASLNRAIGEARAPLLARIDDDDCWLDRHKLQRQLVWLERHPETVLLGTAYRDEWGRESYNPANDDAIRRQMLLRCPFCHSSVVMRKAAVLAVGAYDEQLPYAEDWDLWLRLGTVGQLANLEVLTLLREQGENTLSERFFLRQLTMASEFVVRYGQAYPGALKARSLHRFARGFFSVFPAGGRMHQTLARLYRQVFALSGRVSGNGPPPAS